MSRRRPVSPGRLAAVIDRLEELDWQVLESIDRLRLVSGPQLQRLHHGNDNAAKQRSIRQLTRLSRLGLTLRLAPRVGGPGSGSKPSIYTLDVTGLWLLHPERAHHRQPWTPSNPYLAHHLAVAEVFVGVTEASRTSGIEVLGFTTEPGCWRTFRSGVGPAITVKPDAHVVVGVGADEQHWFVEIDRATENLPRITTKCRTYAAYWRTGIEENTVGVFPRVLWSVPDDRRLHQVIKAIHRLDRADWPLFVVSTAVQTTDVLTGISAGVTP